MDERLTAGRTRAAAKAETVEMSKSKGKGSSNELITTTDEKLNKILQQVEQSNKGIEELSAKFDSLKTECTELKISVNKNTRDINFLDLKMDSLEQYSRRKNLRFFGIPEIDKETLPGLIMHLVNTKLEISIEEKDIESCYRVNQVNLKGHPRAILVKFADIQIKNKVYNHKKLLQGTKITIREDLTKQRIKVLKSALAKFGNANVWTQDGKIKWVESGKKYMATHLRHVEDLSKVEATNGNTNTENL